MTSCIKTPFLGNISLWSRPATACALLSRMGYASGQLVNQFTKLNIHLFPPWVPHMDLKYPYWPSGKGIQRDLSPLEGSCALPWAWQTMQLLTYPTTSLYRPGQPHMSHTSVTLLLNFLPKCSGLNQFNWLWPIYSAQWGSWMTSLTSSSSSSLHSMGVYHLYLIRLIIYPWF